MNLVCPALGGIHKQVFVLLHVKLTFGEGGGSRHVIVTAVCSHMLCWYNVFVLELLNMFVGKELLHSHVCSWALPVSGVDRALC